MLLGIYSTFNSSPIFFVLVSIGRENYLSLSFCNQNITFNFQKAKGTECFFIRLFCRSQFRCNFLVRPRVRQRISALCSFGAFSRSSCLLYAYIGPRKHVCPHPRGMVLKDSLFPGRCTCRPCRGMSKFPRVTEQSLEFCPTVSL